MITFADWLVREGKTAREYQAKTVAETEMHLDAGRRPLIVAPTGAGKSVMSAGTMRNAISALAIVHTLTLREQSRKTIAQAQIATIQGLVKPGRAGDLRREAMAGITDVFVDEAHHIVSEDWKAALPLFAGKRFFGATATPERGDGSPLGDAFDVMVVAAKYSELVAQGSLCPCDIQKPELSRKEQKLKKVKADGVASYLKYGLRADGTPRPGILFDRTIVECETAAEQFNAKGIRAKVVTKDTSSDERQAIFDAYTAGELDMLCSPQALAEGFDSPRAEVCILLRSAAHVGGFLQMVGRVLRPHPGKDRALLIDCSDATSIHGLPTADRIYSLTGKGIALAKADDEEIESETETTEREYAKVVQMKFTLVRDKLRDMLVGLTETAKEKEYKMGWVFHRFTEKTGIQPPRVFEAKYQSICKHCRHRVSLNEQILWGGTGQVFHVDCWFETLQEQQLLSADELQPKAQRLLADLPKPPTAPGQDFIPL